jgi:hypothetical protein
MILPQPVPTLHPSPFLILPHKCPYLKSSAMDQSFWFTVNPFLFAYHHSACLYLTQLNIKRKQQSSICHQRNINLSEELATFFSNASH